MFVFLAASAISPASFSFLSRAKDARLSNEKTFKIPPTTHHPPSSSGWPESRLLCLSNINIKKSGTSSLPVRFFPSEINFYDGRMRKSLRRRAFNQTGGRYLRWRSRELRIICLHIFFRIIFPDFAEVYLFG